MKRSKGGGNENELSPFWINLCTHYPCEAERLGCERLGWEKHFPTGASCSRTAPTSRPAHGARWRMQRAGREVAFPQQHYWGCLPANPSCQFLPEFLATLRGDVGSELILFQKEVRPHPELEYQSFQAWERGLAKAELMTGVISSDSAILNGRESSPVYQPLFYTISLVTQYIFKDPRMPLCFHPRVNVSSVLLEDCFLSQETQVFQ